MGKGQLWDDSALINAFDNAISTYKKMHGKECEQVSDDVNANSKDTTIEANQYNQSHTEMAGSGNDASHERVKVGEMQQELGSAEGNVGVNSQEHSLGSNTLPIEDPSHQTQNHYSSAVVDEYNQSAIDEYNQLYKEYYEIEEQQQRILERLQQFSSSGEASVWGSQWGINYTNHSYQSSATQVPCGCVAAPSNHYINAPAAEVVEKKPEDVDIIEMAMGAAERAISSFKDKTNGLKEENKVCSEKEQSNGSETDLSVVLNAWFSAGFHTGKYLAEQSLAKKQHD